MLYYEAKDLPIFYFFQFTELAAFKYFFWMKTILAYKEYNKMQFEDSDIMGVLHGPGLEIIKTYNTRFNNYAKKSFENTIKKSLLISSVSEKERNRFFNMLRETVSRSRKELIS